MKIINLNVQKDSVHGETDNYFITTINLYKWITNRCNECKNHSPTDRLSHLVLDIMHISLSV